MDNVNLEIWWQIALVVMTIAACVVVDTARRRWLDRNRRSSFPDLAQPDLQSSAGIRIYLAYALETGGEARFKEALRTVQVTHGWTDMEAQAVSAAILEESKDG